MTKRFQAIDFIYYIYLFETYFFKNLIFAELFKLIIFI